MDVTTAADRARQINAQNPGWCLLAEDPAHWSEYGVLTADDLDRYLLWSDLSDTFKEVNGFRPRFNGNWTTYTVQELQSWLTDLHVRAQAMQQAEEREEADVRYRTDKALTVLPLGAKLADIWPGRAE